MRYFYDECDPYSFDHFFGAPILNDGKKAIDSSNSNSTLWERKRSIFGVDGI